MTAAAFTKAGPDTSKVSSLPSNVFLLFSTLSPSHTLVRNVHSIKTFIVQTFDQARLIAGNTLSMATSTSIGLVYEIVEAILLHATTFDIMVATSVCRYWREVVESSKALRKHFLFQLPKSSTFGVGSMNHDLETPWHLRTKPANHQQALFVLNVPDWKLETFILTSKTKNNTLTVLDRPTSVVYPVLDRARKSPNLEWQTTDGTVVCRTRCKPNDHPGNFLREYLLLFYGAWYGQDVEGKIKCKERFGPLHNKGKIGQHESEEQLSSLVDLQGRLAIEG